MKKALVIEDDRDSLKLISYALRRNGYEVIAAGSGEDGVEMTETTNPIFIIMDIDLPGIDGLETTRRIRESGLTDVPIIAITSLAMSGDRERIMAAGLNAYIEKPIDPLTIVDTLHKIIKKDAK